MENYGKYSWSIQMKEHPRSWMFLMRSIISIKVEIHFSYSTLTESSREKLQSTIVEISFIYPYFLCYYLHAAQHILCIPNFLVDYTAGFLIFDGVIVNFPCHTENLLFSAENLYVFWV